MTDGSLPLANAAHERFCQEYAVSSNAADAWRKATGKSANADVHSAKWIVKDGFSERIAAIRKESARVAKIDKDWLIDWYCRILIAKPEDASADSDICETVMTKAGPFTTLCPKMPAAQRLAEMCGFNAPVKVAVTVDASKLEWAQRVRGRKE